MDPAKRNYQIYDKEMLAIMDALAEWRPYLLPLEDAFEIWTDHANLQYYRSPQKLTRRQARWTSKLQEYNYVLKHVPGKTNGKADPLSRRPDYDDGKDDNAGVVILKDGVICQIQTVDEILQQIHKLTKDRSNWDDEIIQDVNANGIWLEIDGEITNGQAIYVPKNQALREEILDLLHTTPTAGHPGPEKTLEMIQRNYDWPWACSRLSSGSQVFSSFPKPFHLTRYWSFLYLNLESRTSSTSCSWNCPMTSGKGGSGFFCTSAEGSVHRVRRWSWKIGCIFHWAGKSSS
jgi:hypothetical protein